MTKCLMIKLIPFSPASHKRTASSLIATMLVIESYVNSLPQKTQKVNTKS